MVEGQLGHAEGIQSHFDARLVPLSDIRDQRLRTALAVMVFCHRACNANCNCSSELSERDDCKVSAKAGE